jgi:hypothetical protein
MRALRFHLIFVVGCILIFAAVEFLFWKFNLWAIHHLNFFFGLWYNFNFAPHFFSDQFSGGISDSPIFWKAAIIEWFVWGIVLSFVFTGFRIRCNAKPTRSQHLREIILLMPCFLPLILGWCVEILYHFGIEVEILEQVGVVVAYASSLLVIYAFAILIFLAYQKNPLWIKTIEVVLVFYSLNKLIITAIFFTPMLFGFQTMPAPG